MMEKVTQEIGTQNDSNVNRVKVFEIPFQITEIQQTKNLHHSRDQVITTLLDSTLLNSSNVEENTQNKRKVSGLS